MLQHVKYQIEEHFTVKHIYHHKKFHRKKDTWAYTKMLIINEVSFLDEDSLKKLDKHLRTFKEKNVMFGGVHVVFW